MRIDQARAFERVGAGNFATEESGFLSGIEQVDSEGGHLGKVLSLRQRRTAGILFGVVTWLSCFVFVERLNIPEAITAWNSHLNKFKKGLKR
jgi:hypothetical protein